MDLLEVDMANIAVADDYANWLRRGAVPPEVDLEF
jgi:hypothetical protein